MNRAKDVIGCTPATCTRVQQQGQRQRQRRRLQGCVQQLCAMARGPAADADASGMRSGVQILEPAPVAVPRRALLAAAAAAAVAAGSPAQDAAASKLPEAVDRAWEGLGGGPADLVFPDSFLGVWDVDSVLTRVELPLGPEFVPDMRVVQRAQQQDLNSVVQYQVAFLQNQRGEVVPDRSFNTASLMQTYLGTAAAEVQQRIRWNPDDPNLLQMALPGGLEVSTRVTRRSEDHQAADRLSTSEYFQQLISTPQSAQPKVKASQCFTKYHWRSETEAAGSSGGGVQVVATQVVSDYLTSFDDPQMMMASGGKPVVVYTYHMAFRRPQAAAAVAAAVGVQSQPQQ